MNFPEYNYHQYNKIQGLPFMVAELKEKFTDFLKKQDHGRNNQNKEIRTDKGRF